jgi:DNA-binding FadR family transcriptional regulator
MIRSEVKPRREALHDTIQHRIERYIIDNGSRPGDALPSQQELARALGISMPSLREAMKSLEALGVVEVRQGSGTYVGRFSFDALVDGLAFRIRLEAGANRRTIGELLDIRMILEQAFVREVVALTSNAHIDGLYALVDRMDSLAAKGLEFPNEDWLFHELLFRPVNNAMLEMLVRAFWDLAAMVRNEFDNVPIDPMITAADHRTIVDAISARDADRAVSAIAAHFDGIRSNLKHD